MHSTVLRRSKRWHILAVIGLFILSFHIAYWQFSTLNTLILLHFQWQAHEPNLTVFTHTPDRPSSFDVVDNGKLLTDDWEEGPLLRFSDINPFPTLNPSWSGPPQIHERAVVTTMYTDHYAHAVSVLGHSLNLTKVEARKIVAYIPSQVSEAALCMVRSQGWETLPVARIAPPRGGHHIHFTFVDQYTKLRLWQFEELGIQSLVYLDADTLVIRPFDELFELPFSFAAAPDCLNSLFNAGVMVLHPNHTVFNDLIRKVDTAQFNYEWAEQTFLNLYFGRKTLKLPWQYNANLWLKRQSPELWEGLRDELSIIHFTSSKPFEPYDEETGIQSFEKMEEIMQRRTKDKPEYREESELWVGMWRDMVKKSRGELQQCMRLKRDS
ncbi:nucleotide-diphospho-sugar transferase [Flagelloscypha sp. PMI_526]|nr:nucleotide-diphospho-sugar transferase [Flagelloscypha sp. PMI_526]